MPYISKVYFIDEHSFIMHYYPSEEDYDNDEWVAIDLIEKKVERFSDFKDALKFLLDAQEILNVEVTDDGLIVKFKNKKGEVVEIELIE